MAFDACNNQPLHTLLHPPTPASCPNPQRLTYQYRFDQLAADYLPITPISYPPPADDTTLPQPAGEEGARRERRGSSNVSENSRRFWKHGSPSKISPWQQQLDVGAAAVRRQERKFYLTSRINQMVLESQLPHIIVNWLITTPIHNNKVPILWGS